MRPRDLPIVVLASLLCAGSRAAAQDSDGLSRTLRDAQYDLAGDGRTFLLSEAASASFFMLGELHGDNETPTLVRALWPGLWQAGYRHIAAELSPWAATRLAGGSLDRSFSWSQADVRFVADQRDAKGAVLWGCDMEEVRPHFLIRELAAANPTDAALQSAAKLAEPGYQRPMAPVLLEHLRKAGAIKDPFTGGVSLRDSIVRTLEIEVDRSSADSRLRASTRREALMKELFHQYWVKNGTPKVMLRFGSNHLHRGLDRRGVSTLGNFVAELAAAQSSKAFNVVEFAGGGTIAWGGQVIDFAGQLADPALAYLASLAGYPATVFDLRPIRQALHRIPEDKRSPAEASLVYWSDSYDAAIFYREVTPVRP